MDQAEYNASVEIAAHNAKLDGKSTWPIGEDTSVLVTVILENDSSE